MWQNFDQTKASSERSLLARSVRAGRKRYWPERLALAAGFVALAGAAAMPQGHPQDHPQERPKPPPQRAGAARAAAPPNLVLLTLDTTRADHLGAWGWPYAHTPNLDALAARGTRFVRCDTAAPITLVSHATLLSGLFPPRHGVRDNGTFVLPDRVETVARRLAARGYDTAAVVSAVVLARRQGLGRGFRIYDDDLGTGYAQGTLVSERPAEQTTAAALAVLGGLKPPFFLWVHYFDPHEEYRPPTRFADAARGPHRLYDGEIAYMDEQIGALLRKLPAATDVVAVGDHGEMLGEHGELTHGLLLYQAVRRVPLILAGPGIPAGAVRHALVRTVDVTPTLLTLAGAPPAAGLDGQSLLPLPDERADRSTYSESFLPFFAYKWYPLRALGSGRLLYLLAPRPGLYAEDGPGAEARDLAAAQPAAAARLRGELAGFLRARGEGLEPAVHADNVLSAEQRRQLASLGYSGGGAGGQVSGALPDPRAMTAVAQALHGAAALVQQGKCAEALPELQKIVQRDPHDFPALDLAGLCLKQAGRLDSALALFERSGRENPLSAVPVANAAGALLALGRKPEAEREYRHALTLDPTLPEAASNLARMRRARGDRRGAAAVADAALAGGAHAPEVYSERGLARAESGDRASALADFREAARRSPSAPVPLENAAHAAFELGRSKEAAILYEELLRLVPGRLDAWKVLGTIYLDKLGDRPEALRCFRRALILETDGGEKAKLEGLIKDLEG